MKNICSGFVLFIAAFLNTTVLAQVQQAKNPVIFADVPDMSMLRVGDIYYMSSTTMHMSPGVPIMKSKDLINWKIVNYAYDVLDTIDELTLKNGKNTYGKGSWASSIRYHNGSYYVSTFAQTTGKTYVYSTKDIEKGPWIESSFKPSYHDNSLFFDDDGRIYMIYGNINLRIVELNEDLSGTIVDTDQVLIENTSAPSGPNSSLGEGSQLFKVKGKYYLFNITWPRGGMRTVVVHRADKITGPWEGRLALQDKGDDFNRRKGDRALPLVWQWNHNPDNKLWSVSQRKGYLRLTTGRIDTIFVAARNTLTQRTFGPESSGSTSIDVKNMKEGDFAGLALLQRKFGLVGVRYNNGTKSIVMVNAQSGKPVEVQSVPLAQEIAYLKAECNFRDRADAGNFFYSLDGNTWTSIGTQLKMEYSMPHFMGYRFGLFNYATKTPGGFVDFDFFHINDQITNMN